MKQFDYPDLEPVVPDPLGGEVSTGETQLLPVVTRDHGVGARRYRLLVPLRVDDGQKKRRITQVRLRLPDQSDFDDLADGVLANRRALLARLTDLDVEVIKALAWPDSEALHQMFADLLPDFLKD